MRGASRYVVALIVRPGANRGPCQRIVVYKGPLRTSMLIPGAPSIQMILLGLRYIHITYSGLFGAPGNLEECITQAHVDTIQLHGTSKGGFA